MKMRLALAASSGLLLIIAQPNPVRIELGIVGLVALAPLFLAIDGLKGWQAFKVGFVAGAVAFAGILYWVAYTMTIFGGMSWPLSIFALLLLIILESLYVGLFAVIYSLFIQRFKLNKPLAFAVAWCASEYLRGIFPFGGFPWALSGYSLGGYLYLPQLADVVGVYGLGFMLALVAALVGTAATSMMRSSGKGYPVFQSAAALLIVVSMYLYGQYRVADVDAAFDKAPELEVALLQGNIAQDIKWDKAERENIINTYVKLSEDAVREGSPDLIIWPEASIPFAFEHDMRTLRLRRRLSRLATYFLVGSPEVKFLEDQSYENVNAAFFVTPSGGIQGKYYKMHLVPFGEYVPMEKLLFFVDKVAGGAQGNFSAGDKMEIFSHPKAKFGCTICYEVIFPGLSRAARKTGAEFLATITNDAWFGRTSAPYQHFRAVVLRSIENHTYYVRSANTGITGIVDPAGRVKKESPLFAETLISGKIRVLNYPTFFTKFGDVLPIACLLASIIMLFEPLGRKAIEKIK